jgi:hypothetical protein
MRILTPVQWLLSLGCPLSGDLSHNGHYSENWFYYFTTTTVGEVMNNWQGDAEHSETMFCKFRRNIGLSIAIGADGRGWLVLNLLTHITRPRMRLANINARHLFRFHALDILFWYGSHSSRMHNFTCFALDKKERLL